MVLDAGDRNQLKRMNPLTNVVSQFGVAVFRPGLAASVKTKRAKDCPRIDKSIGDGLSWIDLLVPKLIPSDDTTHPHRRNASTYARRQRVVGVRSSSLRTNIEDPHQP